MQLYNKNKWGRKKYGKYSWERKWALGSFLLQPRQALEKETVIVKEISVIKERPVLWAEIAQNPEGKTIPS